MLRWSFAFLCAAGLLVAPPPAAAEETARGVVFDDRDGDGARGPDEPGVPGVRVSDGRRVVVTGPDGSYALPVAEEAVVFVTKPAGWATPASPDGLPRFYHVHRPEGSPPGLRYPGVAPTGPLPAAIDFPLRRQQEPSRFEAVLLADTQPQTTAELDYLRDDVLSELVGTGARFGMTLGDILFDDLSFFPRYIRLIGRLGIPWYHVPGNHELNLRAEGDRHSLETFTRYFGPPYYAFEYADACFVVLDDIDYQGGNVSDPMNFRGQGGYEARIGKQQLGWLKQELRHVPEDKLLVLAMHAPLRTYIGDAARANVQDRRKLFSLLEGRPHLYAVAGHTHTTEHHYFGREDGFPGPGEFHHHVLATASGSWWSGPFDERGIPAATQRDGTPNGYHVLEVDGVEVSTRYKAAGLPADHQMRVVLDAAHFVHRPEGLRDFRHGELLDARISVDEVPSTRVLVNLFDGGPRSRVELAVGDREPVAMTRTFRIDPAVNELFLRHADTKKPWVDAVPSSHLWAAPLPELGPGVYTLSVRATDEFGRSHHAHRLLEVTGSTAP